MARLACSRHGQRRAAQRAIPPLAIQWLLDYGRRFHSGGAEIVFFDKPGRRRLARDVGSLPLRRLGSLLDTYVVVADGEIITVGHRTRRVRRPS